MYFTLLLAVVSLLALYSIRYSLNYLSTRPVNSNFTPLYLILSFIYIRNPLTLIFLLLNLLIDSILIFNTPILLIFTSSTYLLPIS